MQHRSSASATNMNITKRCCIAFMVYISQWSNNMRHWTKIWKYYISQSVYTTRWQTDAQINETVELGSYERQRKLHSTSKRDDEAKRKVSTMQYFHCLMVLCEKPIVWMHIHLSIVHQITCIHELARIENAFSWAKSEHWKTKGMVNTMQFQC